MGPCAVAQFTPGIEHLVGINVDLTQVVKIANLMRGQEKDRDELIADGMLGLAKALVRYEDGHGAKFSTYASHRIQGEMRDGIRRRHGRGNGETRKPRASAFTGENLDKLPSPNASALDVLEQASDAHALRAAVTRLPGRQRRVIELYFFGGLNLRAIGALLGFTEGFVCTLKNQGVILLRELYRP